MQDIEKISTFYKESVDSISFKLNEIYELFKDVQKFDELIKSIKNSYFSLTNLLYHKQIYK